MVDADDFSSLFEEDLAKNAFVSEKKTLISENLNKNFEFLVFYISTGSDSM